MLKHLNYICNPHTYILHYTSFSSLQNLIEHLSGIHSKQMDVQTMKFENLQAFQSWTEEEELYTKSQYIKKCAPRPCVNGKIFYFYCNRAGMYKPRGQHLRQLKSQGTAKLGEQCTAHMKTIVDSKTGLVHTEYCATHHCHSVKISHLKIPNTIRMDIAAKLHQGVSMERILDDIRDAAIDGSGINRQHLVNKQSIREIKETGNR